MKRPLICIAAIASAAAVAQETPTFSVDVNVVNILATVRDAKGALISTLTRDDFTLAENGQSREIRYFSLQKDQPLTLGLLVDTSGSQRNLIDEEREASAQFFEQVMRAQDRGFVMKFDFDAELLQDLTHSKADLLKSLDLLQSPVISRNTRPSLGSGGGRQDGPRGDGSVGRPGRFPGGSVGWPGAGGGGRGRAPSQRPSGGGGGGTALYDAVFLAADEVLAKQPGRKAVILISDGVDRGSKLGVDQAIEACLRADTIVYSIRYADDSFGLRALGGLGADGKRTLEDLSIETGGRQFEVNKKQTLDQTFAQIQDELRNQYSIGFTPGNGGGDLRQITLLTKDRKLKVQTRSGFYKGEAVRQSSR